MIWVTLPNSSMFSAETGTLNSSSMLDRIDKYAIESHAKKFSWLAVSCIFEISKFDWDLSCIKFD